MKYCIYTSCSKRKSVKIPDNLNGDNNVPIDPKEWIDRINKHPQKICVDSLYIGNLWQDFKKIYTDKPVDSYVISSGCGLKKTSDRIPPYAITCGRQNFKINYIKEPTVWWDKLCEYNNTSIYQNVLDNPDKIHIFAIGTTYLKMVYNDIIRLKDRPNVWIVTSDHPIAKTMENNIILTSLNYKYAMGGNAVTIHVRAMGSIIDAGCSTIEEARKLIETIESKPNTINAVRVKLTDVDLTKTLNIIFDVQKNISYSKLLTIFRRHGVACQDARLKHFYNKIRNMK